MIKRFAFLLLSLTMAVTMCPLSAVYATGGSAESKASGQVPRAEKSTKYVNNEVIVLYKEGQVTTEAPTTTTAKKRAKSAPVAKSFGGLKGAASAKHKTQVKNTLDDQVKVLGKSLNSYEIKETFVFDGEKDADEKMVVSVVRAKNMSTKALMEKLKKNPAVKKVSPNGIRYATSFDTSMNDAYRNTQWQLGDKGINVSKGWEAKKSQDTSNDKEVVVGVIDTGVNYNHEDLASRMWAAPKNFPLAGYYGYDFSDEDTDPDDENGHGSHCSGIIAAEANNSTGVIGVAGEDKNVKIMALRVLDSDGAGTDEEIIAAFNYAIDAAKIGVNIKALNVSLGGYGSCDIYDDVIDKAGKQGIITVIAAGNESANNDTVPVTPANSNSKYAITVAATDEDGSLASYSNYGRKNVDVAAPGSNILSTVIGYMYMPEIYDKDTLAKTTQVYGQFAGSKVVTDADGTESVTPTLGKDINGQEITGVETFGASVQEQILTKDSHGTTKLEVSSDTYSQFPAVGSDTSLRWTIKDAKAGDSYILYFPYKNEKGVTASSDSNMARKVKTDGAASVYCGDMFVSKESDGKTHYTLPPVSDVMSLFGEAFETRAAYWQFHDNSMSSIWRTTAATHTLFRGKNPNEYDETKGKLEGNSDLVDVKFGYGCIVEPETDGDFEVDLNAMGITRADADYMDFGNYDIYSGTSMATPVVTGSVALLASLNPDLSVGDLRNTAIQTTRDGQKGKVSSEGIIDFKEYVAPSAEATTKKPILDDAKVDFTKKTVTLTGANFGEAPVVTWENALTAETGGASEEVTLPASDVSVAKDKDGKELLTIQNAGELIGRKAALRVNNGTKTGKKTLYLINGLKAYSKAYEFKLTDGEEDNDLFTKESKSNKKVELYADVVPTWLVTGDRLLGYSGGNVYTLNKKPSEDAPNAFVQVGPSIDTAIEAYAKKKAKGKGKNDWLWKKESNQRIILEECGEATYLNGKVYVLMRASLGTRTSYMLCELSVEAKKPTWKICSDTMTGFGSLPAVADGPDRETITDYGMLAGYNGKLYFIDNSPYTGEVYVCNLSSKGATWKQVDSLPDKFSSGYVAAQGGKLYYLLGVTSDNEINYDVFAFDGKTWEKVGTLPKACNEMNLATGLSQLVQGETPSKTLLPAVGVDKKGIILAGVSFDGMGDTMRFNTSTKKCEMLPYALWNGLADKSVWGASAGNKMYVSYSDRDGKIVGKTFNIDNNFCTVKVSTSGKGSGTVTGAGSYENGKSVTLTITPKKGSYVKSIASTGKSTKKYSKPTAANQKAIKYTVKATKNITVKVVFAKKVTSLKLNKTKATVKRGGSLQLKATPNGDNKKVAWKSSNKSYVTVSASGKVTVKKSAKAGKTVTITATSLENKKAKKTCKITIK